MSILDKSTFASYIYVRITFSFPCFFHFTLFVSVFSFFNVISAYPFSFLYSDAVIVFKLTSFDTSGIFPFISGTFTVVYISFIG